MIYKLIWNLFGYNINFSINRLNLLESLSKEAFWKEQIARRNRILNYHCLNTPWYRDFINNKGDDWEDLPIITKKDLQNFTKNNSAMPFKNFYHANTSGSSGEPFSFWKDKKCHSIAWAKIEKSYLSLRLSSRDKEARFIGRIKGSMASSIVQWLKSLFFNRVIFDILDLSDAKMLDYIEIFKREKIKYVYGYSSVIIKFSKFILEKNIKPLSAICPSLKICIVTAEMCNEQDRKIIKEAFGVNVYKEYGASEVSIIAIENMNFDWEISTDRLWVEVLNEEKKPVKNGEIGSIVITDLYNKAFPFIRYKIGDVGAVEERSTYPYMYLKELWGRESDLIVLPSGRKAPGLIFYYISRSILEKAFNVEQFIIIQKSINTFLYKMVLDGSLTDVMKNVIINETEKYLEPGLIIHFEVVNEIEKRYANKIQHFFSQIER